MKKRFWGNVPYLWIAGVLGLGALVALYVLVGALRFNLNSNKVDGQVLTVQSAGYGDAPANERTAGYSAVEYSFTVGGKSYRGKDTSSVRTDAQTVAVYYLPDNPGRNRLSQANGAVPGILMAVLAVLAVCSLVKWIDKRRHERQEKTRWLLASGERVKVILPRPHAR